RWQKKMHFLLTTLKVVYVLTTPMPELMEDDDTVETIRRRAKWENDDYICRGHILNGKSDSLFDIYQNVESTKELWDSFESKYMAEDASSKKFLVCNFNNYKMVDSRPVMEQFNELLIILGYHLRIEESLRAQDSDKGKGKEVAGPSVNMTEEGVLVPTRNQSWNVGSVARLVTLRGIAVVETKRTTQMLVVRERGLRTNPKTKVDAIAWWIDDHFALVHGKGSVVLEFSSGKSINLFDVLYVPKLRFGCFIITMDTCTIKEFFEMPKDVLIPDIDEKS
ncbi:hypothetical protein Tco_0768823, partial [Tanacetum coccineum]